MKGLWIVKCLILLLVLVSLAGCDQQPKYDGENPKDYWYKNCKDKPFAVQDTENCRRSLKDLRLKRIHEIHDLSK